jgi:hypothetical protein
MGMSEVKKERVEVEIYQWVQRAQTVTILVGPNDDIEQAAMDALNEGEGEYEVMDYKDPEFDYTDPFTGAVYEGGRVYEVGGREDNPELESLFLLVPTEVTNEQLDQLQTIINSKPVAEQEVTGGRLLTFSVIMPESMLNTVLSQEFDFVRLPTIPFEGCRYCPNCTWWSHEDELVTDVPGLVQCPRCLHTELSTFPPAELMGGGE